MNPKASEYEDEPIPHIDTTSKKPVWEPSETSFQNNSIKLLTSGEMLLLLRPLQEEVRL